MDDVTFSVDAIYLDEIELRVRREDTRTWRWQVLYVGQVQIEGVTHEDERCAFELAQRHRDVFVEHELNQIASLT